MADDLKRVGVVFTADGVADFKAALQEVSSSINENISAYKLAQSQWSGATTITEKLGDKQKFLAQQTADYQKKVELLTKELNQMENAENRDEAAINKKKAQLEQAQTQLNRYKGDLEKVTKELKTGAAQVEEYAAKLKKTGEAMEKAGEGLTKTVTAPLVAIGAASVKTAADFEEQMDKVGAISMASAEDMELLGDKAKEMGASTKFSATEAGQAMEYMAMAGWKTEDMLDGVGGVMNLAAASGEDLATTSDIVTDALTAFGLSAKDSGHFADVLAAASSNANTNVSMMGETFKYAAPIAGALGFSVEDTAEAIGLMANAGIKGSQAGTSLRTIMTNLSGDVRICGENIGEVTVATTNADGSMRDLSDILADCRDVFNGLSESEQAATAESLVGKNAMSGFLALMNAGEDDIDKLGAALDGCSGTFVKTSEGVMALADAQALGLEILESYNGQSEAMAAIMGGNLNGKVVELKSKLEALGIQVGEVLMPYLSQFVDWLSKVTDKFSNLSPKTQETIVKIGAMVAAIGPLLIIGGKVVGGIGTVMGVIAKLMLHIGDLAALVQWGAGIASTVGSAIMGAVGLLQGALAAFGAFATSMLQGLFSLVMAHPVVAVATAIIATVALLYAKCEWFRDGVNAAVSRIKEIVLSLPDAWERMKNLVSEKLNALHNAVSSKFDAVQDKVRSAVEKVKGLMNFEWSLPHIKLPHFKISGKLSLDPPSMPTIGVDWYAKGGILTRPTIFGQSNGRLLAGGENGSEAVLPIELLKTYMREVMTETSAHDSNVDIGRIIKDAFKAAIKESNLQVVLDREKVGEFVNRVVEEELFS